MFQIRGKINFYTFRSVKLVSTSGVELAQIFLLSWWDPISRYGVTVDVKSIPTVMIVSGVNLNLFQILGKINLYTCSPIKLVLTSRVELAQIFIVIVWDPVSGDRGMTRIKRKCTHLMCNDNNCSKHTLLYKKGRIIATIFYTFLHFFWF